MSRSQSLPRRAWDLLVRAELEIDQGPKGDITTSAVVAPGTRATAEIVCRQAGTLCGLEPATAVFELLGGVECWGVAADGADLEAGDPALRLRGEAASILTGERTALNLLSHLSGIATATRELCRRVRGTRARVLCTRKTTPGLRGLEKYAVRVGGGLNHRHDLSEAVLIKDNHVTAAGSVEEALRRARRVLGASVPLQVEVQNEAELGEALAAEAEMILLDNWPPSALRRAVREVAGRAITEASGGIDATTVRAVAETGVDRISVGWITHSAPALDFSLDLEVESARHHLEEVFLPDSERPPSSSGSRRGLPEE